MKKFKLKYKELTIDPIEYGRLSACTNDKFETIGVVDSYLNNTYDEAEFIDDLKDVIAISHDAFHEAAEEMNIDVKDVKVYDAQYNLTNRSINDYIETDVEYDYIDDDDYE